MERLNIFNVLTIGCTFNILNINKEINEGPTDTILSDAEETLYESIQTRISNDLRDDEHNNTSDVYGGVTVNEIVGKWGHHDNGSEERVNEPGKE